VPGETPYVLELAQFKQFYMSLLTSTMSGSATCTPEQAQAFRDASLNKEGDYKTADGQSPELVLKLVFNNEADGSGEVITRTYTFYNYSARQCFVSLNGKGSFYILQNRVTKLVKDAGLVFTPETPIVPEAKN
jgi:hypothetical protein